MLPFLQSRLVVTATGVVYALFGLALAGGGAWLVLSGGSLHHVLVGICILGTGALLIAGRRSALWVHAAVLVGTLVRAVSKTVPVDRRC